MTNFILARDTKKKNLSPIFSILSVKLLLKPLFIFYKNIKISFIQDYLKVARKENRNKIFH